MGVDLSTTLPRLLKAKGWTQERLGKEAGIRRTDINAIAKGNRPVGPTLLQRIADALEVSLMDLGVDDPARPAEAVTILERLARVEAAAEVLTADNRRLNGQAQRLTRRVRALEQRAQARGSAADGDS